MENLNITDVARKIRVYLRQSSPLPFFISVDNGNDYNRIKKIFGGFERVYVSDFCRGDCFLAADLLADKLNKLERDAVVFGLGEYVFFTGQERVLMRFQDRTYNRKIIFVCRGISDVLKQFAARDLRFQANNFYLIESEGTITVERYSMELDLKTDAKNFSELIELLERGKNNLTVKTELPLLNVRVVNSLDDVTKKEPKVAASSHALNKKHWGEYLAGGNCGNYPPEHWRSFVAGFKNRIADPYLKFVFARSPTYLEYRRNLFFAIFDVDEKFFGEFYIRRKEAVKNLSAQYLSEYLERLKDFPDAIKYLTDNTTEERRAMIRAVQGKPAIPNVFKKNYPAMSDYLSDFDFGDEEITAYFRRYKKIKLCNVDDENFKQHVRELALTRPYNRFDTRQRFFGRGGLDGEAVLAGCARRGVFGLH